MIKAAHVTRARQTTRAIERAQYALGDGMCL